MQDIELDSILSKLEEKPLQEVITGPVLTGTTTIKVPEKLDIDPVDIRNFYEFVNNFLNKRLPVWALDEIELKNITTLTCRIGDKYGAWLMQYALEGECALFIALYILARLDFGKQEPKEVNGKANIIKI